jgi:protein gp37
VLRQVRSAVRFLSIEPLLEDVGELNLDGIHWVIVGGESGPRARPMDKKWVVSIRRQCREQKVPFFFKQWGGVQKSKHGRLLDGRTYDELPPIATVAPPPRAAERTRLAVVTY